MKKILLLLALVLSLALFLASCDVIDKLTGKGDASDEQGEVQEEKPKHRHAYSGSTCTESSVCACGDVTAGPLGHDMTEPTCTSVAVCQRKGCDFKGEVMLNHTLSYSESEDVSSFKCVTCGEETVLDECWYLDGTHYDGMVGVANSGKYTTADGSHQPLITDDGTYQLLNVTGEDEQFQVWVPSNSSKLNAFTSENGSVGFFAFKINAQLTSDFGMKFVDTNSSASRWSKEWCIREEFFKVSHLYLKDGKAMVTVYGWDMVALAELEADIETEFSGWIDVVIGIELDSQSDTIALHYYVNGDYCATLQKPLTTDTNGINSVYIDGHTTREGMGLYLDDIVFGYVTGSEWKYD